MAITTKKIRETLKVCKRFVEAATAADKAFIDQVEAHPSYEPNCPKETGAVRRASLDLTRSLADLRRSR